MHSTVLTRFAAVTTAAALVLTGALTGVASADPLPYAELEASATFDKPSFDITETVVATITIKNLGGVAALNVRADTLPGSTFSPSSWGSLFPHGQGVRIEAGATLVTKVTGTVWSSTPSIVFKGKVYSNPFDGDQANNVFETTAGITIGTGGVAYTVYADGNGNGAPDTGEGLAGVSLELWGRGHYAQVTGLDGTVVFTDVLAGLYSAVLTSPDGWLFPDNPSFTVTPDQRLDVVRRGVRPLSDTLTATLAFDRDVYAVGDVADVTITLTNTGADLPAVHAYCGGNGEPYDLYNNNAGWGALRYGAEGVPLAAGETEVVHVAAPLTTGADAYGFISAMCEFGSDIAPGAPFAVDKARIPGRFANASGVVLNDHDGDPLTPGQPVGGVGIALLDIDTGDQVATAVTDSAGAYAFTGVPVGRYTPAVSAPWRVVDNGNSTVRVVAGAANQLRLDVVPST
ncbi:MAG TPA: carboxypeptidase regulatory-like domain-containing protein [Umezawaea sp.]|nr:carboxypeptidase regulatory-like domain-containing protein [Umezawaea sp.]